MLTADEVKRMACEAIDAAFEDVPADKLRIRPWEPVTIETAPLVVTVGVGRPDVRAVCCISLHLEYRQGGWIGLTEEMQASGNASRVPAGRPGRVQFRWTEGVWTEVSPPGGDEAAPTAEGWRDRPPLL